MCFHRLRPRLYIFLAFTKFMQRGAEIVLRHCPCLRYTRTCAFGKCGLKRLNRLFQHFRIGVALGKDSERTAQTVLRRSPAQWCALSAAL